MLRIGLTGGIACGKSFVLARLAARGFHTLDLDRLAHEVMAPGGSAYAEVVREFGSGVLSADGQIDRGALAARVFQDAQARKRLNAVVHPRVREAEARRVAGWAADPEAVVVSDAALLVEAGVHLRFDRLVVVHCRPEQQLERLMKRDGLDAQAARARIEAQMPIAEKRCFAHLEVDTAGTFQDTLREADAVAQQLAWLAKQPPQRRPPAAWRALGALVHGPSSGPRGLTPLIVLESIASAGGLELEPLARRLLPPAPGDWYRAACTTQAEPGPETLMAPLVLWSLYRAGPDPPFLLAAAASLARMTHGGADAAAIGSACVFARALLEVGVGGAVPQDLASRAQGWAAEARRWGGTAPSSALNAALVAAARHGADIEAARRSCGGHSDAAPLAGALAGLAAGATPEQAPPGLGEALRALEGLAE